MVTEMAKSIESSFASSTNDISWIPIVIWISRVSLKMQLFRTVRKIYETIGFFPLKPNQQRGSFNLRNLSITIPIILLSISNVSFFLFDAQLRMEYVQSFCTSIAQLASATNHLITFYEIANIQQLMEELGQFILRSKFHIFYRKKEDQILSFFACLQRGPTMLLQNLITTNWTEKSNNYRI